MEELLDQYISQIDNLRYHREILFAALVNTFSNLAWKSKLDHYGRQIMNGKEFIVGIDAPKGVYCYQFQIEDWDKFHCKEFDHSPGFYGYGSIENLLSLTDVKPQKDPHEQWISQRFENVK